MSLVSDPLLHYQHFGNELEGNNKSGEPLVFLHGMLGELQNWNSQAKRFAEAGYQVISIDLRNHGNSPHIKGMSYRQMADDVLALLADLGLSKVHLLGHSMGGKVAMYLALNHSDIIQKLVVVDIAPVAYPLWHQSIFYALLSLPLATLKSRNEADDLLAENFDDAFERAFLLKNLKRVEGVYQWKCDLQEIATNYLKIAGFPVQSTSFDSSVLFIKGEDSDYITDAHKPKILQYFPKASMVNIAHAGHLPHVQQPEDFYHHVSNYLF